MLTSEEASKKVAYWTRLVSDEDAPRRLQSSEPQVRGTEAHLWLTQVLHLALAMLQAARIPVFDPIAVLDCQPHAAQASHWLGVCKRPEPDVLPDGSLINLIREAFILTDWVPPIFGAMDSMVAHRDGYSPRAQAPNGQRVRAPRVRNGWISCSWLQLLKVWSLLKIRGDSVTFSVLLIAGTLDHHAADVQPPSSSTPLM